MAVKGRCSFHGNMALTKKQVKGEQVHEHACSIYVQVLKYLLSYFYYSTHINHILLYDVCQDIFLQQETHYSQL